MKLSPIEKKILGFIHKQYPIQIDPSDRSTIAVGEVPLPSLEDIQAHCRTDAYTARQATDRLIRYKCIAKVHLHSKSEFRDVQLGGSNAVRLPVAGPSAGVDGYQVAPYGLTVLTGSLWGRAKRFLPDLMKWLAGRYLPLA